MPTPPLGKNPDDPGYLGYNTIAVERKEGGNPQVQQWNLTLERELPLGVNKLLTWARKGRICWSTSPRSTE